ncbi:MAG TPA: ATP-binding protein [Aggregatilinea sp.]|uniref:ATP-binding protein n=1 Tax=Aggregatilinea sp. TaxID=2806333 RepID=UPI002D144F0C|nr:ATP-binding protein [Aggregatilinea sp.]HML20348.1 ATP-binding protein [Aggregatilinea sp.]
MGEEVRHLSEFGPYTGNPTDFSQKDIVLDGVCLIDKQGRVLDFNAAAQAMFGFEQTAVLGRPFLELLFDAASRSSLDALIAESMQDDSPASPPVEAVGVRSDGSTFPVMLQITPVRALSLPVAIVSMCRMTDRQRDEVDSPQLRVLFEGLLSGLQGGVLLETGDRQIEAVNQTFCSMLGITEPPASLIGSNCRDQFAAFAPVFADPDDVIRRTEAFLAGQKPALNDELHMADGRVFARDYIPVMLGDRCAGHIWHYRDMTESFQAQQRLLRLLKLEELNREIIRLFLQTDDVDTALNQTLALAGELLEVSRVYVFHFYENEPLLDNTHEWCAPGVAPEIENLKGLPFDDIVPSFFPLLAKEGMIASSDIRDLPDDLYAMLAPQDIQSVLILPLSAGDRVEGFIGCDETTHKRQWQPEVITLLRTISESYSRALEREQTQQVLIEAHRAAVQVAELRTQFIANMSHEIRTPLTGVLGMLELLLEMDLKEPEKEYASEAFDNAKRLLVIANDFLDFSRLQAGRVQLVSESIDLRAIVTEIRLAHVSQAAQKSLSLVLDIAPDVPYRVSGDARRLRQVLVNFVSNAIKFTTQGTIALRVTLHRKTSTHALVRFEVADTGIGIAPEHLKSIFDDFVQADNTATRRYGGAGLGLSISKQLVEMMGGQIDIKSTVGEGSTFGFTLNLPIRIAEGAEENLDADLSQLRVLILDHEKTYRHVLARQLKRWDVTVVELEDINDVTPTLETALHGGCPINAIMIHDRLLVEMRDALKPVVRPFVEHGDLRAVMYISDDGAEANIPLDAYEFWMKRPVDKAEIFRVMALAARVQVPAMPGQTPQAAATPTGYPAVLVVDDDIENAGLIRRVLSDFPLRIDLASDGQMALELLNARPYALVFMDMQMPVLSGADAIRQIRNSSLPYRDVPIIVLTATALSEDQDAYIALGANGMLSKPFTIKALRLLIQKWLLDGSLEPTLEADA